MGRLTENKTVTSELLSNLVARGLDVEQGVLVVIDGSKALRAAVNDVLGRRTPVQRCQIHKERNVLDHLPDRDRDLVKRRLRRHGRRPTTTRRSVSCRRSPQSSSAPIPAPPRHSRRDGRDAHRHPPARQGQAAQDARSTNPCESMIECVRRSSRNVKHWQNGEMCLRSTAAGMLEAEQQFRRIIGHADLAKLAARVEREVTLPQPNHAPTGRPLSSPPRSHITPGPPPKFHAVRDILARVLRSRQGSRSGRT